MAGELWEENDLVWPDWRGRERRPDNLSSGFANFRRRTCSDLELPDVPFHGLRHTYATLLAARGYSPKDIAEMMGHSRAAFTMSTYAHVMQHTREEIGGAVEAALFG